MPKDRQQVEYEIRGKSAAESKAKQMNEASGLAAGSKINQGLGDLIAKTSGAKPTPTPMPSVGAPKREDFPPGLGGQGEYSRALSAWKAKQETKPVATPRSLGGSR